MCLLNQTATCPKGFDDVHLCCDRMDEKEQRARLSMTKLMIKSKSNDDPHLTTHILLISKLHLMQSRIMIL